MFRRFFCFLGLHRWGTWGDMIAGAQARICWDCHIYKERRVKRKGLLKG